MFKKTPLAAALLALSLPVAAQFNTSLATDEKSVISVSNAVVAETLNAKDAQYTDGAYEVMPGVWSITGLGMDNVNVVETENVIVVFDDGLNRQYAKKAVSLLPAHSEELANNPHLEENYGEWAFHVRRYYNHVMHWFGNDSLELHPLPRNLEAKKMIEAMGGADAVLDRARAAQKDNDHQWAAQLATYAIRTGHEEAKQVKADSLRAMAQKASASNTRNWMLTHALVLEGELELPMTLTGEY